MLSQRNWKRGSASHVEIDLREDGFTRWRNFMAEDFAGMPSLDTEERQSLGPVPPSTMQNTVTDRSPVL